MSQVVPPRALDVTVPFLDLGSSHAPIQAELLADIAELIESSAFTNGPAVSAFETEFAAYCRADYCVGVANGLDALRLALLAAKVGPADEVIVPAMTFVATFEAVTQAGAVPIAVDVREDDYCLDPVAAARAVTSKTRSLLPVHLYGHVADMSSFRRLADERGLFLLEDACQAHGAVRDGVRAGEVGDAAAFSFYPGKNLGAMGDAGALVTDDHLLADEVKSLREHGQRRKYEHDVEGWTARLDTIQALVLRRKLPLLDEWNDSRRAAAAYYAEGLAGVGDLRLPPVAPGSEPVWHLFVVRTADPESLSLFLRDRGIASGRHYPQPPHLTDAYARLGYAAGDFPVAEAIAAEGLSLPVFPGMTELQLEHVVAAVGAFFRRGV
jgi:dTDP-4-amino-4,6-dideoxygalactose transaminase